MGATLRPLSEEFVGESVESKVASLIFCMHEGTPIKSHIFSIINDLDKTEVKIEYEDQAHKLQYFLPLYKRFREVNIYGGKSTIKVIEVKKNLFNKDKFDNQLTGESHRDDSEQVHFSKEKSDNGSSTSNPKH